MIFERAADLLDALGDLLDETRNNANMRGTKDAWEAFDEVNHAHRYLNSAVMHLMIDDVKKGPE